MQDRIFGLVHARLEPGEGFVSKVGSSEKYFVFISREDLAVTTDVESKLRDEGLTLGSVFAIIGLRLVE